MFSAGRDSSLWTASGRQQWYHQWVYFRPRAYWQEWLTRPTIFAQTGIFPPGRGAPARISANCCSGGSSARARGRSLF
ncbi:hypothetical protein KCP69_24640 [Salmonella enterica subsp. enterica]|nr:hypothetical protein KCP69_24640 [Salmonella enterica subsp. enterica]